MNFNIKCSNCKRENISNNIRHNIPGGIRGCGPQITVNLCSEECLINYKKKIQCQVCKCTDNDQYIIDDVVICDDNSSYMERPTCREQYTNEFVCDFCDIKKTSDIYKINNDSTLYSDNEEYIDILLLCENCYNNYSSKCNKSRIYINERKFNVKEINFIHPNYSKILIDYKIKINELNMNNIKKFITKIKNEKEDEFDELFNFIRELKNK